MCGLTGFWDQNVSTPGHKFTTTLTAMRDTLIHRGPDGAGLWFDIGQGIGLAHRRLSIVDLSDQGKQPMRSANGRYVISFNGEIYNHLAIKKLLTSKGHSINWRGNSDTEVMLAAFEVFGVEDALQHFVGMFAIALWDTHQNSLYLIRDRMGEKPLYYGWLKDYLVFGSELKSLRAHFAWHAEIAERAVSLFLQYNCIPAPNTIYKNIYKVMPGHMLVISADKSVRDIPYWQLKDKINIQSEINPEFAMLTLEKKLRATIAEQMLADVPVGAFLSGGIDSASVVALMQQQSATPVKTFTIGFADPAFNEANIAKEIAKHLGTEHTELYLSPETTQSIIPQLADFYDEPFADSSQLPTYFVAKLTKEHVTVSLSGDGGDELFAGYNRYAWTNNIWSKISLLPLPIRKLLQKTLITIAPKHWDRIFNVFNKLLPSSYRQANAGDKIHKLAQIVTCENLEEIYYHFLTQWHGALSKEHFSMHNDIQNLDFTHGMMYMDSMRYLPDDILVKVDRAAMAVSLETRIPFLDHRIQEYVWNLPLDLKIRNNQSKWLLRQILYKYVPEGLFNRPKMGFGVPIHQWIREHLREWSEDMLAKSMLNKHNLLDKNVIARSWTEHKAGVRNWQYQLWSVLMFQSWYEVNHG